MLIDHESVDETAFGSSMTDKLRIGVAGAGAFGREHLRRLAAMPDVEIAGIADIDLAAARAAAQLYGVAEVGDDAMGQIHLLDLDGVVIATPGDTHLEIALDAIELGVAALVEKPVAMNAEDAALLEREFSESRAFGLPGHVLRFSAHHRLLYEIVHSGEIGPILSFMSRRHRDETHASRYASVDPVLMTMIHDIDLGLWMTGAGLAEATALRRPAGIARSDTMAMGLGKNGAIWQLHAAWTFPGTEPPQDRVEIVGERGGVELEAGSHIRQYGAKNRVIDLKPMPEDPLAAELRYFADCIRKREAPRVVTLQDARAGLEIADAIRASLKRGERIRL